MITSRQFKANQEYFCYTKGTIHEHICVFLAANTEHLPKQHVENYILVVGLTFMQDWIYEHKLQVLNLLILLNNTNNISTFFPETKLGRTKQKLLVFIIMIAVSNNIYYINNTITNNVFYSHLINCSFITTNIHSYTHQQINKYKITNCIEFSNNKKVFIKCFCIVIEIVHLYFNQAKQAEHK